MNVPQAGVFALGTASHAYLEFDARDPATATVLVGAVARLREPRTTMGGVNLVAGFRPELWRSVAPDDAAARAIRSGEAAASEALGGASRPCGRRDQSVAR